MNVKEQYWKYSLVTIIIVLGMILFVEFIPFLGGILGACTIYILVRKQMLYLTEKKHLRRSFVAIILLLETILCFLIPLSLDWNSVAGHHPRADRFARILDIRCAESLPFRLSDLFCYDHSGCGDCVGLVAFGSLYGVDRGLGECCRIDGLCFDYHYECG